MLRANPMISASLAVAFAAGAAAVFTMATDTRASDTPKQEWQVNRAAKSDRLVVRETSVVFFDAQPIAHARQLSKPAMPVSPKSVMSEQILPERANSRPENTPRVPGCETGVSPDLAPKIPLRAGRCIAGRDISMRYASLH